MAGQGRRGRWQPVTTESQRHSLGKVHHESERGSADGDRRAIVGVWLFNCLNIMREYERAVVFRLGRVLKSEKDRVSSSSSGRSTRS